MHSHQDIEVKSHCLDAAFPAQWRACAEVQHTTVGRGMFHEETSHRPDVPMTFLQIWVTLMVKGLMPSMEQLSVDRKDRSNRFLTLASYKDGSAPPIAADAEFVVSALEAGKSASWDFEDSFGAYFFVAEGQVAVNGERLKTGDTARATDASTLDVRAESDSELAMVVVRV